MNDTESYILEHIKRVQFKLIRMIKLLVVRCVVHDKSKLQEPEFSLWVKMDEEPKYRYGTKEYEDKIKRNKKVFELHYKSNRHHPEHFANGIYDMNLIDLLEMCCDWISYKDDIRVTEAIEMVEMQSKRFGFSDEIKILLKNTIFEYFASLGDIPCYTAPKEMKQYEQEKDHIIDFYI